MKKKKKGGSRDTAAAVLLYLAADAAVSVLFYHSPAAFVILLPGFPFFLRLWKEERRENRRQVMRSQFLSAMQLVSVSMQAGYVPENAFCDALGELEKMYGANEPIVEAFGKIRAGLELNRPLEELLWEMGQQSGVEDMISFAEVFGTIRRSGGDMIRIVRNTTDAIRRKEETLQEIEAVLAGKQLEQRMMSVIPLFILGYVSLTSPGFLDVMYHNTAGVIIMTLCLIVYIIAFLWAGRIMRITV